MPSNDLTAQFRKVVHEKQLQVPVTKRRKLTSKSTNTYSGREGQILIGKEYLTEAYLVLDHINTLTRMLANIRNAYLNIDSRDTRTSRQSSGAIDLNKGDSSRFDNRYLTNEERDQIDLQARLILTRCADRVKGMEALEKRRSELLASQTNPFSRLLPPRLRQDVTTASSDFLAVHHSGITWYLSRRLAEASKTLKEMQEERMKRQLERTRTLGSGATREALRMVQQDRLSVSEQAKDESAGSWLGDASSSLIAATIGARSQNNNAIPPSTAHPSDDEDDEIELSASQILQFETENANILRAVQDTLESVQQAEARLMDISVLQMELVTHLTRQTELTDQLYEDAIATTSMVEKGNEQLKEVKRRANDSRLFILVFLVGASMSLLFLHYY